MLVNKFVASQITLLRSAVLLLASVLVGCCGCDAAPPLLQDIFVPSTGAPQGGGEGKGGFMMVEGLGWRRGGEKKGRVMGREKGRGRLGGEEVRDRWGREERKGRLGGEEERRGRGLLGGREGAEGGGRGGLVNESGSRGAPPSGWPAGCLARRTPPACRLACCGYVPAWLWRRGERADFDLKVREGWILCMCVC